MKILLIYNLSSGHGNFDRSLGKIKTFFKFNQIAYDIYDVRANDHLVTDMIFLAPNYDTLVVASALSGVVPPLAFVVSPILMMGVFLAGKHLLKEKEVQFEPIFAYFKDIEHGFKIFVVSLLVNVLVVLGLILFIVPGIIFALKYSQAAFLMSEDKNLDIMDALKKSGEMMQGYKMNLFLFGLSFIGHILLGMITLGLYLLYAMPYIVLSFHNYYLHLKALRGYGKKSIDAEIA